MLLLLAALDLDAALQHGAVLHADAHGGNVSCDRAFAADIHAVAAIDVSVHLAHHHNLAGSDVGLRAAVAADGDAVVGQADLAFDAAVDVERFRSAQFALDHERAADGGLLNRRAGGFHRIVRVRVRGWRGGLHVVLVRLEHATFLCFRAACRAALR